MVGDSANCSFWCPEAKGTTVPHIIERGRCSLEYRSHVTYVPELIANFEALDLLTDWPGFIRFQHAYVHFCM